MRQRPPSRLSRQFVLARYHRSSRIEPLALCRRSDGAQIFAGPENAVANASYEIVNAVADGSRNYGEYGCQSSPPGTQSPEDVNHRVRAHEEGSIDSPNDNAVGKPGTQFCWDLCFECHSLEWRETKRVSRAIVFEDEFDRAVAKGATPIVKKKFASLFERRHG